MRLVVLLLCAKVGQLLQIEHESHQLTLHQYGLQAPSVRGVAVTGPDAPWVPYNDDVHAMHAKIAYPRKEIASLDDPPRQRWKRIIGAYKEEIIPHFQDWQEVLNRHTEIDQRVWAEVVHTRLGQEYLEELEGILEVLSGSQVTRDNLLLFNAIYEMGSPLACSGVLAAATDGTILHGRNLDYKLVSPLIEITFVRGGKIVYVAPMYLGTVGVHTVIRPHHWSLGTNARVDRNDTVSNVLERLKGGSELFMVAIRKFLDQDLSYSTLVTKVLEVPLCRSLYLIIGGAGAYEGSVITHLPDPSAIKMNKLSAETNDWYLFQANEDSGGSQHLLQDERGSAGLVSMSALSQNSVNPTTILEVMLKPPVYTKFNVVLFVMAPKAGLWCSILGPMVHNDDLSISETCSMPNWRSLKAINT